MENKICIKCKELKRLNEQNFYKAKTSKDGYMGICKNCKSEYDKAYVEKNKSKVNEYKKKYVKNNKEKIKDKLKKYRENNKDSISEYSKKYSAIKENKERKNYLRKLKYKTPPKEKRTELYIKDKENTRIRAQKYRASKKQIYSDFTKSQWEQCKKHFNNSCAYCGKQSQLHQEHFVPLSKGGTYTKNNIIPACKECNSSKCNKTFEIWYKNQPYYNKEKELKILEYLERIKA